MESTGAQGEKSDLLFQRDLGKVIEMFYPALKCPSNHTASPGWLRGRAGETGGK